jgi:hypothetical protein
LLRNLVATFRIEVGAAQSFAHGLSNRSDRMTGKPQKSPKAGAKGASRQSRRERTPDDATGGRKGKLPPIPEGRNNLRQRAAWFQRRTGGKSG